MRRPARQSTTISPAHSARGRPKLPASIDRRRGWPTIDDVSDVRLRALRAAMRRRKTDERGALLRFYATNAGQRGGGRLLPHHAVI
jgi:hypothetical protein